MYDTDCRPTHDVRVVAEGEGYVVEAQGELDLAGADALVHAFRAVWAAHSEAGLPLTVDLSGVTFMDSEGLRQLLRAGAAWAAAGSTVRLRRPTTAVETVLRMAGVTEAFDLDP